jgi:hypothetical protein
MHRIYVQYSADAIVKMNWDEQYQNGADGPSHPHSQALMGEERPACPTEVTMPTNSEKGRWKYVDKVFDDKQKDVPFPEPVLDTRKEKDILGKKKKNKG